jgi:hypothetical protein
MYGHMNVKNVILSDTCKQQNTRLPKTNMWLQLESLSFLGSLKWCSQLSNRYKSKLRTANRFCKDADTKFHEHPFFFSKTKCADGHDLILTSLFNCKCQGKMTLFLPRKLLCFLLPCAVNCTTLHPWVIYMPPGLTIKKLCVFHEQFIRFLTVQSRLSEITRPIGGRITENVSMRK